MFSNTKKIGQFANAAREGFREIRLCVCVNGTDNILLQHTCNQPIFEICVRVRFGIEITKQPYIVCVHSLRNLTNKQLGFQFELCV